ncbi:MAG: hypothetical protein WA130_05760 [Candidatus Methanoperedens sp.]
MITADEVKKTTRNKGFPAGVVEKDYALTWLLYGVYFCSYGRGFACVGACEDQLGGLGVLDGFKLARF